MGLHLCCWLYLCYVRKDENQSNQKKPQLSNPWETERVAGSEQDDGQATDTTEDILEKTKQIRIKEACISLDPVGICWP